MMGEMGNGKWVEGKGGREMVKGKIEDFSQLRVWQKAKELTIEIYQITKSFPKVETYAIVDQIRRSSNSICANIAEGFSRYHGKDKMKFYYNARGSISEVRSHIFVAKELGYISNDNANKLLVEYETVKMMLNGLINSIANHHRTRCP